MNKPVKLLFFICVSFSFLNCQIAYGTLNNDLFVSLPSEGKIQATFHPESSVIKGALMPVSFGVPFPKGTLFDSNKIRVIVNGDEVAIYTKETSRWHKFNQKTSSSVRSVLIHTNIVFINDKPLAFSIEYGVKRNKTLDKSTIKNKNWVSISKHTNPNEYPINEFITEPSVYVTYLPDWLSACLLKTRTVKLNGIREWSPFDNTMMKFANTAVNDVSRYVKESEKIDYVSKYAPWLFDRASVLFTLYIRTGDVKWLRHAHRATQFYANHIDEKGYFNVKKQPDFKYSYGQSMMMDLVLMGDLSYIPVIERVASAGFEWPENYSLKLNFWTERHLTYSILAALSAWEATGKKIHSDRIKKLIKGTIYMAEYPFNGRRKPIGCLLHTMQQHEGDDSLVPFCSPWMSALLSDAMWRYYILSEDIKALEFIFNLASFVTNHGIYTGPAPHLKRTTIPWYLASSTKNFSDSGPWADLEHTCDVAGLLARGAWSAKFLDRQPDPLVKSTNALFKACVNKTMKRWHRNSEKSHGKPNWRLSPPRKFSWWFGTNSDASWLMQEFNKSNNKTIKPIEQTLILDN